MYWYLLQENDADRRSQLFLDAMGASEGLSVPAALIKLDIDRRANNNDRQALLTDLALDEA